MSAISQSSFFTRGDVKFIDNISFNKAGYTFQFLNTKDVSVKDTSFSGNP